MSDPFDNPAMTSPTEYLTCDDCGEQYLGPAYYSFEPTDVEQHSEEWPHQTCTESICPKCAGDLWPDNMDDPRAPEHVQKAMLDNFTNFMSKFVPNRRRCLDCLVTRIDGVDCASCGSGRWQVAS